MSVLKYVIVLPFLGAFLVSLYVTGVHGLELKQMRKVYHIYGTTEFHAKSTTWVFVWFVCLVAAIEVARMVSAPPHHYDFWSWLHLGFLFWVHLALAVLACVLFYLARFPFTGLKNPARHHLIVRSLYLDMVPVLGLGLWQLVSM